MNWISLGPRSGATILTAPGTTPDTESIARLDAARAGFAGPVPRWYDAFKRLGSWWYLVLALTAGAIYLAIAALSGEFSSTAFAASLSFGLLFTYLATMTAASVAEAQSRRRSDTGNAGQTVASLKDTVRAANTDAQQAINTVLGHDPTLESELHEVLWRCADLTSDHWETARADLRSLMKAADGSPANDRDDTDDFLRRMKDQGKI